MSCADSDEQRKQNTERYRSGHNEAVLKTVCPQGHMGSNPILSARRLSRLKKNSKEFFFCVNIITSRERKWFEQLYGEVPKLAEGTPLERVQVVNSGARVQIPPSPLAQKNIKKIKKVVDKHLNTWYYKWADANGGQQKTTAKCGKNLDNWTVK